MKNPVKFETRKVLFILVINKDASDEDQAGKFDKNLKSAIVAIQTKNKLKDTSRTNMISMIIFTYVDAFQNKETDNDDKKVLVYTHKHNKWSEV